MQPDCFCVGGCVMESHWEITRYILLQYSYHLLGWSCWKRGNCCSWLTQRLLGRTFFTLSHSSFTSIQFYTACVFLVTVLLDFQYTPNIFLFRPLRSITVVLSRWTLVIWRELKCETCRQSTKCFITFIISDILCIFAPTVGKVSKVKSFKMQIDAAELLCFSSCCVCLLLSTFCFPLTTKGLFGSKNRPFNLFNDFYCLHEHLSFHLHDAAGDVFFILSCATNLEL